MSDMLEQCKEVVEEMTRKVVEFVENNVGMVEDNLGQVGNNLEEAWGNMVEEYFSGDDAAALQVIVFSCFLHRSPQYQTSSQRHPQHHLNL